MKISMKILALAAGLAVAVLPGARALAGEKVTIGALRFTSSSPLFVAYERGYFSDAGLDVEFKFFQGAQPLPLPSPLAMQTLASPRSPAAFSIWPAKAH